MPRADMKRTSQTVPPTLEQRIRRLEKRVALLAGNEKRPLATMPNAFHPALPLGLGVVVLVCGYLGLDLPRHYYQPLFAGLVVVLVYHRQLWSLAPGHWRWPQIIVNFLILSLFFKLLVGGGTRYPLEWLKVPVLKKISPTEESPWYDQLFPNFDVAWQGIPAVTDLSFDVTMIQSFLLIATLAGAVFRFQPFASLTAVLLLLVSIPTFISFNWEWVVLFLVLGGASLYLQTYPLRVRLNHAQQKDE